MKRKKWMIRGIALCLVAACLLGFYLYQKGDSLSRVVDPVMTKQINMESVPLKQDPEELEEPGVTTSKSTKTSKKRVTTKVMATKTYTKNLGTTNKSMSKNEQGPRMKVSTVTNVATTTTEKYTKGSHIKEVTQKTVTTVTVTRTALSDGGSSAPQAASAYEVDARSLAPMMDDRVLSAFAALGFKVMVDPSFKDGEGVFDPKGRTITMTTENSSYIYHELGHFLSFLLDDRGSSKSFAKIFKAEKNSFAGLFQEFAKKSSTEFFAECMREYCNNRTKLKGWCPKAFKVIRSSLEEVTPQKIEAIKAKYAKVWGQ